MILPFFRRLLERSSALIDRQCCGRDGSPRFADRSVRLLRQEESRVFDSFLTPAGRVIGLLGAAGVVVFGVHALASDHGMSDGLRASIGALMVPVVLGVVRLARGHFSEDLHEP
jgi:hypothetical protein